MTASLQGRHRDGRLHTRHRERLGLSGPCPHGADSLGEGLEPHNPHRSVAMAMLLWGGYERKCFRPIPCGASLVQQKERHMQDLSPKEELRGLCGRKAKGQTARLGVARGVARTTAEQNESGLYPWRVWTSPLG